MLPSNWYCVPGTGAGTGGVRVTGTVVSLELQMKINTRFEVPYPPRIPDETGDEGERAALRSIEDNLNSIKSQCDNLVAEVALYEFCHANPQGHIRGWMFLAGRDGAMSLRNFKAALSTLRSLVGRCASIRNSVDVVGLKEAESAFSSAFPRAEKLRHSVAHPESYSNPRINMTTSEPIPNWLTFAPGTVTIQGSIINRDYIFTINELTVGWEISDNSAMTLVDITTSVFRAFAILDRN